MQSYCERTGPGLFDEPVNAISNVAFLIAAYLAWRHGRRVGGLGPGVMVLIGLATSVGIGSALWHTYATGWAMYLDVIPIVCFQVAFFLLYVWNTIENRPQRIAITIALVLSLSLGLWLGWHPWLNGVLMYVPALILLWAAGWHHYRTTASRGRHVLLAAAAVFSVALIVRSIDLLVCRQFPIGSHFLWHVFNAVVVYLGMCAVIEILAQRRAIAPAQHDGASVPAPTRPIQQTGDAGS